MQLQIVGVHPENIIIFERADYDLTLGNHKINRTNKGIKCFGIVKEEWHGAVNAMDKFDSKTYNIGPHKMHICKIVTDICSVIINMTVVKRMGSTSFSTAMKNHFGSINSPIDLHGNNINDYIAILNTLPPIKNKTILTICDVLRNFGSSHVGSGSIIMCRDQVAMDYTAMGIMEKHLRRKLNPKPSFIETAAKLGVGVADPDKMEKIEFEIT